MMVDAVIQCEGGNCATVLVENHGDTPMKLGKGMMLGNVEPVELVAEGEEELENQVVVSVVEAGPTGEEVVTGQVSAVEAGPSAGEERQEKLMTQLDFSEDHLSAAEKQELKAMVTQYADVFALDSSELGTTDVVEHHIHTGDSPPVRQAVRRTPFALREKIEEMVAEMEEQCHCAIQESLGKSHCLSAEEGWGAKILRRLPEVEPSYKARRVPPATN